MIWLIVLASVLLFLIIVFFIALYILYRFSFYSPHKDQKDDYSLLDASCFRKYKDDVIKMIDAFVEKPFEDVYCQSFDNLKLHGRYYKINESNKLALMFHGYRGTARRDFCGGSRQMMELGYNVLIVDHRGHGSSEGHSITFGVRESKDVVSWFNYAKERFGQNTEIILVGISMGGATVLGACDKVGDNVKVIADCPYTTPKAILSATLKKMKLSPKIFYPIVNLSSIIFGHTNLNKMSAFEAVKNTNNKILILHGDSDSVVPHYISEELYKAYPDKVQYELFPGADHGVSYMTNPDRYKKVVSDFLKH